jgi:hypothetical protein
MKLLTNALRKSLPPFGAGDELGTDAIARVKFFTPDSSWTWYASEFSGDTFFGLVDGIALEYGYFSLAELESVRGPLGLPIERDRFFTPAPLKELYEKHLTERGGSPF